MLLALAVSVTAQDIKEIEKIKDWKLIKEMSGDISNHPGLTIELYAAEIARSDSGVKLIVRADFPWGSPMFSGATYPRGFDTSSISRVVFRVELDCTMLVVKPATGSADVYQFNGKKYKSKEVPVVIQSGHVFERYFCERGDAPTKAPVLRPSP